MEPKTPQQPPPEVAVTLEHPSWGVYTYRVEEGKLASSIVAATVRARKEAEVRAKVADIDAKQAALAPKMAQAHERVKAAEVLGNAAAKQQEERALERLMDESQDFAEQRQKVLATLE
jgi:outer membrane murein-binding lipoprotein Lpp